MKLLVLAAVLLLPMLAADQSITIRYDGGYENIIVAIHKSVPENPNIVKNIKALFTSASSFLHNATRGKFYFKSVTIALPSTWLQQNVQEKVRSDPFPNAPIRINQPSPQFGQDPYTLQPRGCGEPGEYIHFTPDFVINLNTTTKDRYGDPKFHLVHEWAHLRYGVFDEYGSPGDPQFPLFYADGKRILPNTCSKINGYARTTSGGRCEISPNGVISSDCRFFIDEKNQKAHHSLMFMPYVRTINQFCDQSEELRHNYAAPNKHNSMCGEQTVWEVISTHQDFRDSRTAAKNLAPNFKIVQHNNQTQSSFVLVLDVSGSMNTERLNALKKSASLLIKDIIPDEDKLAIFSFNSQATKVHDLTVLRENRTSMITSIKKLIAGGGTSIGSGVRAAIKHLNDTEGNTEGAVLIVLTDGDENTSPKIYEVINEVIAAKVIVHTLALGRLASQDLEDLARKTKGNSFSIDKLQGDISVQLGSAFVSSATSQVPLEHRSVVIYNNDTLTVGKNTTYITFRIEPTLGSETVITLKPHASVSLSAQLVNSRVDACSNSSASCKIDIDDDKEIGRTKISILGKAIGGVWTLYLNASSHVIISCEVTSKPVDVNKQPIRLRTFFQARSGKTPAIFSEVKQGQQPVLRANVIATVARPSGKSVQVLLKDDGIGADVFRDDGVYSAYFTQFAGQGRYAVVAHVSSTNKTLLGTRPRGSRGVPIVKPDGSIKGNSATEFDPDEFVKSDDVKENDEVAGDKLNYEFQRYEDAGSFMVDQKTLNLKIPPGKIVDLKVKEVGKNDSYYFATLEWTSPGDKQYVGKAKRTDVFVSNETTFIHAKPLKTPQIISGDLGESEAGKVIRVTVNVSDLPFLPTDKGNGFFSVYFRANAHGTNTVGESSNIVIANFGTYGTPPEGSNPIWPIVVGVVVGVLVLGVLAAFVILFLKRRNRV